MKKVQKIQILLKSDKKPGTLFEDLSKFLLLKAVGNIL